MTGRGTHCPGLSDVGVFGWPGRAEGFSRPVRDPVDPPRRQGAPCRPPAPRDSLLCPVPMTRLPRDAARRAPSLPRKRRPAPGVPPRSGRRSRPARPSRRRQHAGAAARGAAARGQGRAGPPQSLGPPPAAHRAAQRPADRLGAGAEGGGREPAGACRGEAAALPGPEGRKAGARAGVAAVPRRQAGGSDGPDRLGLRGCGRSRASGGSAASPASPPPSGGLALWEPSEEPPAPARPAWQGFARQRWELSPENPRAFSARPRCFPRTTGICPAEVANFSREVHSFGLKLILTNA